MLRIGSILATAPTSSGSPLPSVLVQPTPSHGAVSSSSVAPGSTGADSVVALPTWLLISLLCVVGALIVAVFVLTFYYLSAPRSTLKNLLGLKERKSLVGLIRGTGGSHAGDRPLLELIAKLREAERDNANPRSTEALVAMVESLGNASRVNKRTTRTTLAITGFSLLGLLLVAVFGISGPGARDLRAQVAAALVTLVATIAGFYFGASNGSASPPDVGAPKATVDPKTTVDPETTVDPNTTVDLTTTAGGPPSALS